MSKKGLFSSLIVGLVVTLALGIYTIVSVVGGNSNPVRPTNTTISLAFRTNDTVDVLEGYSEEAGNLSITLSPETTVSPLTFDAETGKYTVTGAGSLTAVITLDAKENTKTVNITAYNQGTGASEDDAYIIANAAHLQEFAALVNTISAERVVPAYTKLVSDIDLSDIDWKPIGGQGNTAFTGVFDGNGYTVENMKINVNTQNYGDYAAVSATTGNATAFIDLGLFGRVEHATIKNLNIENAVINVEAGVYSLINSGTAPEGAEYVSISRLAIGTVAGFAYDVVVEGNVEAKNTIVSRINAFSCTNTTDKKAHGIGGVVGVANLTRTSNYKVSVNVINNNKDTLNSYVGGVYGYSASQYDANDTILTPSADHITTIDAVDVEFAASLLYKNGSFVGGMIGSASNTKLVNSNVNRFKVVDNTDLEYVEFDTPTATTVAGIAGVMRTLETNSTEAFVSLVENVVISNIDVYMIGGDISGAFGVLGKAYSVGDTVELTQVKDVLVSGKMKGNVVTGIAYQVNPSAKVVYTKAFENPVIDIKIEAYMSAGIAHINLGEISGFADENGKTVVKIETVGSGAKINTPTAENLANGRATSYAVGLVANMYQKSETLVPSISNFSVDFKVSDSINMAGVAYKADDSVIENIDVNTNMTSYNYSAGDKNFSTTYAVAGVVCFIEQGTTINNVKVVINANQDVDTTKKYGTTFFGGIVARFLNESNEEGMTIENCEVSGNVFFNDSYENVTFVIDAENNETIQDAFMAGGIVGAMQKNEAVVDTFTPVSVKNVVIANNKVSGLKIVAGFTNEVLGTQGWRVRGVGAVLGVLNTDGISSDVLDLSTNVIENVEIVANEEAFSYSYETATGSIVKLTLGAKKENVYGSSFDWNNNRVGMVTNPSQENLDQITYTEYTVA